MNAFRVALRIFIYPLLLSVIVTFSSLLAIQTDTAPNFIHRLDFYWAFFPLGIFLVLALNLPGAFLFHQLTKLLPQRAQTQPGVEAGFAVALSLWTGFGLYLWSTFSNSLGLP